MIYLRPMTEEDTADIVAWRNSPGVRKSFIYQEDFTPEGHLRWLHEVVQTGRAAQMMICEEGSGRALGSVYIRDIDHIHHKGEYGIFLGTEEVRGRGIGTEAARLMIAYGFETLGLHRIYLRALSENARAIRSYEKAGFEKEGCLKDDVCIHGEYKDIVWMAIVRKDTDEN
ncbi:MAG: UDP-4-amino-4,6-dideoxy-N-acetyl-beta-L-altrosamine N-acetyltransferase [Lachnospiraceae bacterium]|nr:UDP-4-amino-4,6-dideoxy-N-acetyl-beta-L-altrosamine N-acetyltransferase [Lachnospiraceae bacterium]